MGSMTLWVEHQEQRAIATVRDESQRHMVFRWKQGGQGRTAEVEVVRIIQAGDAAKTHTSHSARLETSDAEGVT